MDFKKEKYIFVSHLDPNAHNVLDEINYNGSQKKHCQLKKYSNALFI